MLRMSFLRNLQAALGDAIVYTSMVEGGSTRRWKHLVIVFSVEKRFNDMMYLFCGTFPWKRLLTWKI